MPNTIPPASKAAEEAQFGLSEINWGILPGGGASKVAVELLSFRREMYHAIMGENIDGKTAAEWGLTQLSLFASGLSLFSVLALLACGSLLAALAILRVRPTKA